MRICSSDLPLERYVRHVFDSSTGREHAGNTEVETVSVHKERICAATVRDEDIVQIYAACKTTRFVSTPMA